ncbi:glucosamine kinase [Brenneria sp. g21c3]|uniref:glucosamine kinase n=1 Tax=Brenneria sp. g21c3 TaxID=3093893 RepID=UPI002E9CD96B|nr:glucosamine kinase [Brenneria sp. g21c3]
MKCVLKDMPIDADQPFDEARESGLCQQLWPGQSRFMIVTGGFTRVLYWHDGKLACRGGECFPIGNPASLSRLGLWAIQEMLQAVENIMPLSPLSESLFAHFNNSIEQVIDWSKQARPEDYTRQAKRLLARRHDDVLSMQLLRRCAGELNELLSHPPVSRPDTVWLSGELAAACFPYLDPGGRAP